MVHELTPDQGFALLAVHAAATLTMVGVIWTCQLVHYPLMVFVARRVFVVFERSHMSRISLIVGPAMAVELAAAVAIAVLRPDGVGPVLAGIGLGLVGANALSTALLQGPAHRRLARGFDEREIRFLVRTNWIRTGVWSARGVVALLMMGPA